MRFEKQRTEEELARLDFDEFGHPFEMRPTHSEQDAWDTLRIKTMRELVGDDVADSVAKLDPALARRLGLFPTLRLVRTKDGNQEENTPETKADHPIL